MTFFFFNDTATTEIYTLSLHDALPICSSDAQRPREAKRKPAAQPRLKGGRNRRLGGLTDGEHYNLSKQVEDRKSTRLNSSHANISYAVFCLKKKKKKRKCTIRIRDEHR